MAIHKTNQRWTPLCFNYGRRRIIAALLAVGERPESNNLKTLRKQCATIANSQRGEALLRALQTGGGS